MGQLTTGELEWIKEMYENNQDKREWFEAQFKDHGIEIKNLTMPYSFEQLWNIYCKGGTIQFQGRDYCGTGENIDWSLYYVLDVRDVNGNEGNGSLGFEFKDKY